MSVQHANRGVVKKDLQLYYNREFVKSFRGEATINTCDLNTRVDYVWANGVVTRDTTAPSPPPVTGFEIAKLRSTDGADTQTILYTAAVDQVNGGVYTHSAYIYLESGTWVSVGQHWNPWDYGVQTYIPLNKWTRVSYTVTNSAANYGQVACSYNTNGTIYITATQYERKSYSTPFVASTLWTPNLVNVVSTNGNTTMTKNTVGNGWTNARVYSSEGYSVPCYVSFKSSQTTAAVMISLNSDPATGVDYSYLDYAFYIDNPGYTAIYESGANPLVIGNSTYTTSTLFEIIYDGTNINYYMDGVLKRTVARSGSGPLYLDSSFWSNSAAINNLSFGPLSGTNRFSNTIAGGGGLKDISGNNVNSNLINAAFDSTGFIFSGSQYITVPYSANLDRNDFTIVGYCRTSTNDNSHDTIVSRNSDVYGATNGWNISRLRNGLSLANCFRFMIYGDSSTAVEPQGPAIADNVWRHFAVVVDKSGSNTVTIYINGVAYSTPATLPAGNHYPASGSPPLYIGCNKTNADLWNGDIPQILYYGKALTAAEVSQNFNATRKTYGI